MNARNKERFVERVKADKSNEAHHPLSLTVKYGSTGTEKTLLPYPSMQRRVSSSLIKYSTVVLKSPLMDNSFNAKAMLLQMNNIIGKCAK
uniref:Uncharacterized protein n=1 Tax=Romanomermis culicivorax TaxID=13658 RepID=A0A915K766_ROMCU